MKTSTIICSAVVLIACFSVAYGLQCHVCVFGEGVIGSDKKCEKKPSHLELCRRTARQEGLEYFNQTDNSAIATAFRSFHPASDEVSRAIGDPLCFKFTAKVGKNNFVMRGCDNVPSNSEDYNKKCIEYKETIGGETVTAKECYCLDKDGCNGAGSLTASVVTFASIALLVLLK